MQKLAAIGDAVNFAARIEQANKELGTRFLIAESTRNVASNILETSEARSIEVKGKSGAHTVYEVLKVH